MSLEIVNLKERLNLSPLCAKWRMVASAKHGTTFDLIVKGDIRSDQQGDLRRPLDPYKLLTAIRVLVVSNRSWWD